MFYLISLLFLLSTSTHTIECMPWNLNMSMSLNDFNFTKLKQSLDVLQSKEQRRACLVIITVDYGKRQCSIQSLENKIYVFEYMSIDLELNTFFRFDKNTASMNLVSTISVFEAMCNIEKWCDR